MRERVMGALLFPTFPFVLLLLLQADLREHTECILLGEIVDRFRAVVERGHGRHDNRTRIVHAQHILQMDAVQGRLTQAEDKGATLLQADVSSACEQVGGRAAGNGAERSGGTRDDGHSVHRSAAGRDSGADVFIGEKFDLFRGRTGEERGNSFAVSGNDAQLSSEEAQTSVAGDKVDVVDAGVGVQQAQDRAGVESTAGSGDADRDHFAVRFGHAMG
jgi:hypothetical protein